MTIPVIILNWNGWRDTFACLRSLRGSGESENVWLVDNGSRTDRTRQAARLMPSLRIIRLARNFGWAGGNNRALRIAAREGIEFAYLLNNDCRACGPFLHAAAQSALKGRRIAAVGSRILRPDGSAHFDGCYRRPGRQPRPCARSAVPYVSGAGMLVRLQALRECGFFDERFFCYQEEVEWCRRSARLGWRCVVSRDSRVIHEHLGSDRNDNATYYTLRNSFLLRRLGHPIPESRTAREFLHGAIMLGETARLSGRLSAWAAAAEALRDGLRGRFGQRSASPRRSPGRLRKDWTALVRRLLGYCR